MYIYMLCNNIYIYICILNYIRSRVPVKVTLYLLSGLACVRTRVRVHVACVARASALRVLAHACMPACTRTCLYACACL